MLNDTRIQNPIINRNERIRDLLRTGQEVKVDYQGRIVDTGALSPPAGKSNLMTIPSGVLA